MTVHYTSLFIITRFQNSLPSCCFIISYYMYPALLHKMAPFCMNTAKKSSGGGPLDPPPFKQNSFRSYYTHKYWKNHYQNIPATKYAILRTSSLQNVMQNIESHVLPPLLNPRTNPPPPLPPPLFFLLFQKFVAVEKKIFCPRFTRK